MRPPGSTIGICRFIFGTKKSVVESHGGLSIDANGNTRITSGVPAKPLAIVDTRVTYHGDDLGASRLTTDVKRGSGI